MLLQGHSTEWDNNNPIIKIKNEIGGYNEESRVRVSFSLLFLFVPIKYKYAVNILHIEGLFFNMIIFVRNSQIPMYVVYKQFTGINA